MRNVGAGKAGFVRRLLLTGAASAAMWCNRRERRTEGDRRR